MNLFGNLFNRSAPEGYTPKTGAARYFEVFWEHLGKMLGLNLLCFVCFLPLAMGISLGLTFENFWLTALGGLAGGFLACPAWISALGVCICCFLDLPISWFFLWKQNMKPCWRKAAREGSVFGAAAGCLLAAGQFLLDLVAVGNLPAPVVWLGLCFDLLVLVLLFVLLVLPLAVSTAPVKTRFQESISYMITFPGRMLSATLGLLLWCMLGISLFPVSIPFAVVIGFWPLLLLLAQLWLPLLDLSALEETAMEAEAAASPKEPKRRNLELLLGGLVLVSMLQGVILFYSAYREPDLQIAVVHSEALPDSVAAALEASLEELVGDQNGDGSVQVVINDYVLVFDGSAADMDIQTAGMTQLVTDLNTKDSCIYIVEDEEGFLSAYADLMDTARQQRWSEVSVLSELDAGTYSILDDIQKDLSGHVLLSDYLVIPTLECSIELITLLLK